MILEQLRAVAAMPHKLAIFQLQKLVRSQADLLHANALAQRRRGLCGIAALLAVSLFALGCEPGSISQAPPAACTETGALCDLGGGPLGVCERSRCAPGLSPPCFHCASQH